MDLLPFFQWCYTTPLGETVRVSNWLFAVIEAVHLLGWGVLAGAVLTVDLRLLGVGLSKQPAAQLAAATRPWLVGSVIVMITTGIPLFLCEAIKCYYSFAFWIKMASLALVLLFTFTIKQNVMAKPFDRQRARLAAVASLVLWFGVAWGGRWIGFS